MRRRVWLVVLSCLLAAPVFGQVTVEVTFDQEQYLAGEPVQAVVRVTNFSGRTLRLGETPEWLDITVEGDNGFLVGRKGDPPVVEAFQVPNSARGIRRVDLVPYFNIGSTGRYRVVATVRIAELGLELASKPAVLDVTSGVLIWEQVFGSPAGEAGGVNPSDARKYALVQSLKGKRSTLYVRVTDVQEARIHRVLPIGIVLGFSHPEAQVDRGGQLHVLYQTSARQFTYAMVTPEGEVARRQTHQYTNSRPSLRMRSDGEIVVHGGVRIRSTQDVPAADPALTDGEGPAAPREGAVTGLEPK